MYCSTKGYYLSLFSSNLQVQFFYFKTSHVIVYQRSNQQCSKKLDISKHLMLLFINPAIAFSDHPLAFQNISCYCLSDMRFVRKIREWGFQNISCYCLSCLYMRTPIISMKISKHLMLLFIDEHSVRDPDLIVISKHLMLLFIVENSGWTDWTKAFQNISCYCLSFSRIFLLPLCCISKHLMLLFIGVDYGVYLELCQFQNISCYCLSSQHS